MNFWIISLFKKIVNDVHENCKRILFESSINMLIAKEIKSNMATPCDAWRRTFKKGQRMQPSHSQPRGQLYASASACQIWWQVLKVILFPMFSKPIRHSKRWNNKIGTQNSVDLVRI